MVVGALFLSWKRPTREQQKACTEHAGGYSYSSVFHGVSALGAEDAGLCKELSKDGFFINRARILLGTGPNTFALARSALLAWRQFGVGWAFVDPATPVHKGTRFCVCVNEMLPWIMMPLQIVYVADDVQYRPTAGVKATFGFGSGTLQGHLLAGEEKFSIDWDEDDRVWYKTFSFSKPAHVLSVIGFPYVRSRQKRFARESAEAVQKHIAAQLAEPADSSGNC